MSILDLFMSTLALYIFGGDYATNDVRVCRSRFGTTYSGQYQCDLI